MLNKLAALLVFFCFALITSNAYGFQSDYITYDWLTNVGKTTSYTDHIPHWRRLFNTMKVRGFLECGCGYSTAYFLDNAEKVISIEYITPGYGDKWYQDCLLLFSDRSNWVPLTYNEDFRSNSFNNACAYQCSMHQDYALIDPTYLKELNKHLKTQIEISRSNGYDIDVAFVDCGVYLRGDLVKLLLSNKIPIVAAHDTVFDNGIREKKNLYGWNKIVTPPNYIKIYIPFGCGTTFWISDELPAVIVSMLKYRDGILQLIENGTGEDYEEVTRLADMP